MAEAELEDGKTMPQQHLVRLILEGVEEVAESALPDNLQPGRSWSRHVSAACCSNPPSEEERGLQEARAATYTNQQD